MINNRETDYEDAYQHALESGGVARRRAGRYAGDGVGYLLDELRFYADQISDRTRTWARGLSRAGRRPPLLERHPRKSAIACRTTRCDAGQPVHHLGRETGVTGKGS